MKYFIDTRLYVDIGKKGRGVFAKEIIPSFTTIEHSPIITNYCTKWSDTPYELKKMVFSFPQGVDNYVIGLGYTSLYNHDDKNNAMWHTDEYGISIRTVKDIYPQEEICIHYGDSYWSGGWTKI